MSKYYVMPMFPYPSGDSMHVGHASNYIINDFVARYKKMQGFDVIHPMGFDSFGLPTENYAIKTGKSARQATKDNIVNFKEQIKAINLQFDPEREFATSDPEYYKWTQWIFARLFEHGLAYKKDGLVNRCNGCQTVLANDQVVDGKCERCETIIIQKKHPQRYIKTTALADELIDDLDLIDRPEETKTIQKNWIGRSFGAEIDFEIQNSKLEIKNDGGDFESGILNFELTKITVFTTRPDTLYGVTALVLAPENQIIDHLLSSEKQKELEIFRNEVAKLTSIDRQSTEREKNGMNSGIFVTHPLTQEQVPVWFADYVLMDYATGAVMMVPAHDERDREFAKRYEIAVKRVIDGGGRESAHTESGVLINSSQFDGIDNSTAKAKITEYLESLGCGRKKTTFRLRDRSVSRQRYRGSPIPVYYTFEENEKVAYFEGTGEIRGPRKEATLKITHTNICIVKNNKTNKYLVIKRTNDGSLRFPGGIIEPGESLIESCKRELHEETGVKNLQFIKELGHHISYFYHNPKKVNFYTPCSAFYFETDSETLEQINEEELQKQIPEWINADEFLSKNNAAVNKHYINLIEKGISSHIVFTDLYNAYNPHPDKSKWIPHLIPDEDLPVILPLDLPNYKPAGKSPLEDHPTFKYYERKELVGLDGEIIDQNRVKKLLWIYDNIRNNAKYGGRETYLIGGLGVAAIAGFVFRKNEDLDLIIIGPDLKTIKDLGITTGLDFVSESENKVIFGYEGIEIEIFSGESFVEYTKHLINTDYSKMNMKEVNFINTSVKILDHAYYLEFKNKVNNYYKDNGGERKKDILDIQALEGKLNKENFIQHKQIYLRECDTLDTFMCSSFYFLRYLDPANTSQLISHEAAKNMPVDLYIGGKEHAVGHLIYSRFIYKFLQKYRYINTEAKEPFVKLIHQGMVHAADGRKFSKRRGNGINPLDVVKEHNTDTLRTYLAFMGPIELPKNWNPDGVAGVGRFLKRFEKIAGGEKHGFTRSNLKRSDYINTNPISDPHRQDKIQTLLNQTIKGISDDMDNLKFNTAISKLMIICNEIYSLYQNSSGSLLIHSEIIKPLIILLAPFAPETAQRMWTAIGQDGDVTKQSRPTYEIQYIQNSTIELPIQINGKTKGSLSVSKDISQDEAIILVRQDEKMSKYLEGGIKKIIRVPGRICNIIV